MYGILSFSSLFIDNDLIGADSQNFFVREVNRVVMSTLYVYVAYTLNICLGSDKYKFLSIRKRSVCQLIDLICSCTKIG